MNPNADPRTETPILIDDIEKRIDEIFAAQKSEVEQSLVAKINREKEEAQRRIEAVNEEFAQVRSLLDEHKSVMAELQTTEEFIRGEIRGHFDRAVNYQKMMENAAALAGDELEKIGGLNQELERVRVKAESEYATLNQRLSGYAGIAAQLPAPPARRDSEVDWTEEIGKLRKVRDLMATLRQAGPENGDEHAGADGSAAFAGATEEQEKSRPAVETAEELAASLGLVEPGDDGVRDDAEFALNDPAWSDISAEAAPQPAEPQAEPQIEPAVGAQAEAPATEVPATEAPDMAVNEDAAVLEALARYRRSESVNNGLEIGFFATDAATWLDGASFMAAVAHVTEGASQLHAQLNQTTSVKDLFLLKQEILNQQEILRKLFFRVVRFCDKEGGRLPETLAEVVSSRGMKEIIERLTMANWSDPSDFKPFLNELNALKRAFEARTSALPSYAQAVLDEVEGRLN
jgi:hypothetical protein